MCIGRSTLAGHARCAGSARRRGPECRDGHPRQVNVVTIRLLAAAPFAALALACSPAPRVGDPVQVAPIQAQHFSAIAQDVLVPRCATASCHAGASPAAWPPLDAGLAYAELVGMPSTQAAMNLVEPFAPESSYLVLKLRGTAASAGGIGTLMPIGNAALDEAEIAAIEAWISNGAPND